MSKNGNGPHFRRLVEMAASNRIENDWRTLARDFDEARTSLTSTQRHERMLRIAQGMLEDPHADHPFARATIMRAIVSIAEDRLFAGAENPALDALAAKMDAIRKAHGLTDAEDWMIGDGPKSWIIGDGPEEYQVLSREWDRIADEIMAATFEEFGEPELATLYRYNRARFDLEFEAGRQLIFEGGPSG
jgi:hypothetical protein